MATFAQIRREYSALRRLVKSANIRLAKQNLPTVNIPLLRDLKNETDILRNTRRLERAIERGATSVEQQSQKRAERLERRRELARERRETETAEQRERRRERQREYDRRRREDNAFKKTLNKKDLDMVERLKRYGVKIKSKEELRKFYEYLDKRRALAGRKNYYVFDKYVDEFQTLKEKGYINEPNFSGLMTDFNAFMADNDQIEQRAKTMKLQYDQGFIDQLYDDFINRAPDRRRAEYKKRRGRV